MKGERGFALVITLVVTALLIAMVVEFIDDVFVETSSRQNFVDAQQASLMANSGIDAAVKLLEFSQIGRNYTTLSDPWAKPLRIADERGALTVTVVDESGKLDLNVIAGDNGEPNVFYYGVAMRLFKNQGLPLDLLDALIDWMDNNDEPKPGGAESAYYKTLKIPYQARNSKLSTLEEVALVKGFDKILLEKVRSFITIYTTQGASAPININTAPREVIKALAEGMNDSLAKRLMDQRSQSPFQRAGEVANVPGLEFLQGETGLLYNLDVKSTTFHVLSEAKVNDTTRTVEAVVRNGAILYWREF